VTEETKTREQLLCEADELRRRLGEAETRQKIAEEALRKLEHRNRLLGDSAPFGILTADRTGRITGFNRKIQEMLPWAAGRDPASIDGLGFQPPAEAGMADEFQRCIKTKEPIVSQHVCAAPHGAGCYVRFYCSPVLDEGGNVTGILAFLEDITRQKLAEDTVRESGERYRLLFQHAPVPLIERDASQLKTYIEQLRKSGVTDFSDYLHHNPLEANHCMSMIKTLAFNNAFLRLLEADSPEQVSAGLYPTDPDEFSRMAHEAVLMIAHNKISQERERVIFTLKGNRRSVLIKGLIVSGHEDTFARIVISLVDISERKQAEEALRISEQKFREQALRDNLTGLYNRRYLYKSLSELTEACKADGSRLSLIFMDLDNFKQVVDAHGHLNGSLAIQEVAATIRRAIREPAYAVAYAGDEFIVVLPGLNQSQAAEAACSIRSRMNQTLYLREQGLDVKLSASFGIGTFPDHAADVTGLLAVADRILFTIKAKGKNAIGLAGAPYPQGALAD
jgi:diguanylate cyclase (GGDEF)-like protein/PAS domain S-box-containing protein